MKRKNWFFSLLLVVLCLIIAAGFAYGEDEEEDGGRIVFTKPVMAVVFEHKIHRAAGLECDGCHDDPFEMEAGNAESKKDFTMEAIYKGKYCGSCHDGDTAFAANTRCTLCHIGVQGYKRSLGKAESEQ